jgi:hypothetical protein
MIGYRLAGCCRYLILEAVAGLAEQPKEQECKLSLREYAGNYRVDSYRTLIALAKAKQVVGGRGSHPFSEVRQEISVQHENHREVLTRKTLGISVFAILIVIGLHATRLK